MRSPYKRVVVKVSGNILFSFDGTAKEIDPNDSLSNILEQVKKCSQQGIQVTLVFGEATSAEEDKWWTVGSSAQLLTT